MWHYVIVYLYHGAAKFLEDGILKPSQYSQIKNGREGLFVFATHRHYMAMVYATPWLARGSMMRTIDGTNPEDRLVVVIAMEQKAKMQAFTGTVYRIPEDGFERVASKDGTMQREWVCSTSIDLFSPRVSTLDVSSVKQLMEVGMQVFYATPEVSDVLSRCSNADCSQALAKLLVERPASELIWANRQDGYVCDQRIANAIAMHTKSQALNRSNEGFSSTVRN